MGGHEVRVSDMDSFTIARKIADHSKTDYCGDKFLKYMKYVNGYRKGVSNNRSLWTELREQKALSGIMEALQKLFTCEEIQNLSNTGHSPITISRSNKLPGGHQDRTGKARDVCNTALSILSNAFAIDYKVRSNAVNTGFISSLQNFIATFTQDKKITFKNAEIIRRAIKCTANLSNDSHCRESVLKTGVAISILKVLEHAGETMTSTTTKPPGEEAFVDKSEIRQLICSCIRAIRILTSDAKFISCGREHLLKFGGLETVMSILTWDAKLASDEDFLLDVVRSLTFLSIRIRSAPTDVINKIIYNPEVCRIRSLVRIFDSLHPGAKLFSPMINCLINLSANKELSDCFGELRIFHMILSKLEDTNNENCYRDLIKLLISLTKNSSFNQSHFVTSPLIGSTLKILKSSRFKDYHEWLLNVYEKLYEVSLSKLVECGLVSHLCDIIRQEMEDCDYGTLRSKISSLHDCKCSIHREGCPFVPVYRCNSPSYQKIREEMKSRSGGDFENTESYSLKVGEDSLSPFSSPSHSFTSGGSSPVYSDSSSIGVSSLSDDEGCYSSVGSMRSSSPESVESTLPRFKRRRPVEVNQDALSSDAESDCISSPVKRIKLDEDGSDKPNENSLEKLKFSVKRIAGVLNILHKCAYISPFPSEMLQIIPILLGIILRGKVSLMPQHSDYQTAASDDELRELSRRTFEVSYKILLKMASIFQLFPDLIVSGMIPILIRLQEPCTPGSEDQAMVVRDYCANLINRLVGIENDTAGWREGFIMRSLLVNSTSLSAEKMDQMILNIPLLYQNHATTLRKFEMKAKSWTKILEMLVNADESSFYRFEDCALALCSICSALGVKWKPYRKGTQLPFLQFPKSRDVINQHVIMTLKDTVPEPVEMPAEVEQNEANMVKLCLDDGTTFSVNKDLLIQASPVFLAMFNGNFIEAGQQKVHLPNVSNTAVSLLLDQIFMLSQITDIDSNATSNDVQYDLGVIFELFSMADRFLLEEVYERTLNTVVTKYICPQSAPLIYAESVKLMSLQKSGNDREMLGDASLNLFILKYVLTAENIGISERCNGIRKMFDSVVPEHIVQDLKALIEHHMYKA